MNTAIAVMAAGESRRFGGCKLLAEIQGMPLLQHTIGLAEAMNPTTLLVITGAWHSQLLDAQQQGALSPHPLIFHPHWQDGLGSSIAFACDQLPPETDRLMILLADQIALQPDDLHQLLTLQTEAIVCAKYNGQPGVPAVFNRQLFPILKTLQGEPGARRLLRNSGLTVHEIELPDAVIDIDTSAQLQNYIQVITTDRPLYEYR